jgi:phosphoribosylformylglycinamidine cyclo-ligase
VEAGSTGAVRRRPPADRHLLEPTRIYVRALLPTVRAGGVHGLAHITGGGLLENIPRVLPEGLQAFVDADAWPQTRLMAFLQASGNIEPGEMARTFNCGIGMAVIVGAGRGGSRGRRAD